MSQEHLPPVHRPEKPADWNGLPPDNPESNWRPFQDDYLIYKWFGIKIPRYWFSRPCVFPPLVLFGSKELSFNNALAWKNEDVGLIGTRQKYEWPGWGVKPYQPRGKWFMALTFPEIFGIAIPLPSISFTLKNGKAFRLGVRWTEGNTERYYSLLGYGTKQIP